MEDLVLRHIGSPISGGSSAGPNLSTRDYRPAEPDRGPVGNYCMTHESDALTSKLSKSVLT